MVPEPVEGRSENLLAQMQPRHTPSRLVVVNGSQPNQKQPKPKNPNITQLKAKAMKNFTTTLIFCLLTLSATITQAGNGNGKTDSARNKTEKLTAESSLVKSLYSDIEQNLRLPAKLLQMYEGEQVKVLFTVDSLGQLNLLETQSDSPFLVKQLERSFKNMRVQANELLTGERFSMQVVLKP